MEVFLNRREAGRALAQEVRRMIGYGDALVLAIPRGGVPVAYEIARALKSELDVLLVRKLGVPGNEELAFGAIAAGGTRVLNQELIRHFRISDAEVERITDLARRELEHRQQIYRPGRPAAQIQGRTIVLVDDGLATGSSMAAAVLGVKAQQPARIVVAVPVAAATSLRDLGAIVDEILSLAAPRSMGAVGMWYSDFAQVADSEVAMLLQDGSHTHLSETSFPGLKSAAFR